MICRNDVKKASAWTKYARRKRLFKEQFKEIPFCQLEICTFFAIDLTQALFFCFLFFVSRPALTRYFANSVCSAPKEYLVLARLKIRWYCMLQRNHRDNDIFLNSVKTFSS